MHKFLFLTIISILLITSCTPAAAPAPTITPADLPVTATATTAPTATPEPTEIPHPEGWEETWVVVDGYWFSPEIAAYVENHDGHFEEIDGRNYFTTTVTVTIDDQTQDVKVKLLEESVQGVMIPSYEAVQELLVENEVRLVLELSRMNNPSEALFVMRSGEHLEEDLNRANGVIQAFVDRVNTEQDDNIWPRFVLKLGPGSNEIDESIHPESVYSFNLFPREEFFDESAKLGGVNFIPFRSYFFVQIMGTDSVVGFIPSSDGVKNIGFDKGVLEATVFKVYGKYSDYNSFSSLIDHFLNTSVEYTEVEIETPAFSEDPFSGLSETIQKEWECGPVMLNLDFPDGSESFFEDAFNAMARSDFDTATSLWSRRIIWTSMYDIN